MWFMSISDTHTHTAMFSTPHMETLLSMYHKKTCDINKSQINELSIHMPLYSDSALEW